MTSPVGWKNLAVEDFAEVTTGGTPSTSENTYWANGHIPWLNSGELNKGVIRSAENFITSLGLSNSAAKLMPPNTVLIALTGATTGVSAMLKIEACANQSVTGILPSHKHDSSFLLHFLRQIRPTILAESYGGAQKHISQGYVKKLVIPFPPLTEQRRIAAILDQADALRAKRREALAQLDGLTQSIFIEMFGDPATGASTLNFLPLESLLEESFQNGAYFPKETYCESGGAEMVHMSDAFGGCVKRGHLKRVNCSNADIKKYALTTNDILIARRSLTYEGAAKPCMIPSATEPLIFESSFIRVRPDRTKITPLYLFHYLNNDRVKKSHIRPYVTQSTISGINQSNLAQVPVLHPPLELQQKFGARVQSIENVTRTQVNSLAELDTLFASLQHRAFRGDL